MDDYIIDGSKGLYSIHDPNSNKPITIGDRPAENMTIYGLARTVRDLYSSQERSKNDNPDGLEEGRGIEFRVSKRMSRDTPPEILMLLELIPTLNNYSQRLGTEEEKNDILKNKLESARKVLE